MTPERLDALLETALATGTIPPDATVEERAELAPLLATSASLKLNAARVASEANAAMPTARARFQRHLSQQEAPERRQVPAPTLQPSFLGRLLHGRVLALGSSVAALAVVAVIAILVLQPFGGVETASALTVDDYVQVQGVVSASDGSTVTIQSPEVGNLQVALSDLTSVTDDDGVREISSLQPGDPVLVSGVVTARQAIAASNVAVAKNQGTPATGVGEKIKLLKSFRDGLQGSIRLISLSPDGKKARVLLVTSSESLLVDVDARSMDQFLAEAPRPLGALVRIVVAPDLAKGVFRLESAEASGPTPTRPATPPAAAPQFQNVRGVVTSRTANVLMVRTERGVVPVVIRLSTSIRFSGSGLTIEDIRSGEGVVGHEVVVSGNQDGASARRVVATLIVVLEKAPTTTR
ncbi:MAG: hypothetical protein ABI577_03045 [bacterium]